MGARTIDTGIASASLNARLLGTAVTAALPEIVGTTGTQVLPITKPSLHPVTTIATTSDDQDEPENLMPRKKLNPLAIPSFVLALGVLYLGFFTSNTLALVVAIVLTLAVSGISLARMRTREQGGKGFALSALMIGVIATIFTAIAIAAFGFD